MWSATIHRGITVMGCKSEAVDVIDPFGVGDIFAEGIADTETMANSCVRYTLYATHRRTRVVVARIVVPMASAVQVNEQLRAFLTTGVLLN